MLRFESATAVPLWSHMGSGCGRPLTMDEVQRFISLPTAAEILQVPATGRDLVFPGLPRDDTDRDQDKPTAKNDQDSTIRASRGAKCLCDSMGKVGER